MRFTKTLLVFCSLSAIVWSDTLYDSCGCITHVMKSFHAQRIPSIITERFCHHAGAQCAEERYRVSKRKHIVKTLYVCYFNLSQCLQVHGLLEVGYTETIESREVVVHKRNLTVGIDCICGPRVTQRFYQPDNINY